MKSPIGATRGVEEWSEGQHYCRVVCSRGHKKRLIDRIRWTGEENSHGEQLYNAAYRDAGQEGDEEEASSPAEHTPKDDAYKWRLSCPCGLNVVLSSDTLHKVAKGLHDTNRRVVELGELAAIVSR